MASDSETGIPINIVHFNELVLKVVGFGIKYNPSNSTLTLVALHSLGEKAKTSLEFTGNSFAIRSAAITDRELAFDSLGHKVTQVINAFGSCGVSEQLLGRANSIVHKLRGQRISPLLTDEQKAALADEGKESNQISASQMGYDTRIENFGKLVDLLETTIQYVPNEEELQSASLRAHYNMLKDKNNAVLVANVALENAYNKRNAIFNDPQTGMVDVSSNVKKYVKSVFKASSNEYKSIAGIKFRNIN